MHLWIKNTTDFNLTLKLYPKSEYMHNGLYCAGDFGSGYRDTEIEINPNQEESIFYSNNLDQAPSFLTTTIFDSIFIYSVSDDKVIIAFSPDTVIGYSVNLFDPDSIWDFEIRKYDEPNNSNRNPVESHNYSFVISDTRFP